MSETKDDTAKMLKSIFPSKDTDDVKYCFMSILRVYPRIGILSIFSFGQIKRQ